MTLPDPNESVSRRHAHIDFSAGSRHYRVVTDDRSAHGTGVLRNGRTITVHPDLGAAFDSSPATRSCWERPGCGSGSAAADVDDDVSQNRTGR